MSAPNGEDSPHLPVLLKETLRILAPSPGDIILDGTLGAAGHASQLLKAAQPDGFLIGMDQDTELLALARQRLLRDGWKEEADFRLVHRRFSQIFELCSSGQIPQPDVLFFDLGLNSYHYDQAQRGFSARMDGPLDMRLDPSTTALTAADLIATSSLEQLADMIQTFGEERFAGPIARAIVRQRQVEPLTTTKQLASLVSAAIPRKAWPPRIHPATRTFQALRIMVNGELVELEQMLTTLPKVADRIGNRIGVIGFHSLELRPVKQAFRSWSQVCVCPSEWPVCRCGAQPAFRLLTRQGAEPTEEEVSRNPRSRSARLWAVERIAKDRQSPPREF
jgi:16S rRNA (cytosine1402-N4)-methyltransferase